MGCGRSTLRQESNDIKRLAGVIESEPTKPRPHPSETGLRSLGMQVSGSGTKGIPPPPGSRPLSAQTSSVPSPTTVPSPQKGELGQTEQGASANETKKAVPSECEPEPKEQQAAVAEKPPQLSPTGYQKTSSSTQPLQTSGVSPSGSLVPQSSTVTTQNDQAPLFDATVFADQNPNGCYLIYDPRDNGTFYAKFSTTVISEALAFSTANTFITIPAFKYRAPVKIQNQVLSGRSNYFKAWCHWIKDARTIEGEMVLLPAFEACMESDPIGFPPMNIFMLLGTKLVRVERGVKNRPVNLKFVDAVACVPESFTGFDDFILPGAELQKSDFLAKAKLPQDKFYIEFNR